MFVLSNDVARSAIKYDVGISADISLNRISSLDVVSASRATRSESLSARFNFFITRSNPPQSAFRSLPPKAVCSDGAGIYIFLLGFLWLKSSLHSEAQTHGHVFITGTLKETLSGSMMRRWKDSRPVERVKNLASKLKHRAHHGRAFLHFHARARASQSAGNRRQRGDLIHNLFTLHILT